MWVERFYWILGPMRMNEHQQKAACTPVLATSTWELKWTSQLGVVNPTLGGGEWVGEAERKKGKKREDRGRGLEKEGTVRNLAGVATGDIYTSAPSLGQLDCVFPSPQDGGWGASEVDTSRRKLSFWSLIPRWSVADISAPNTVQYCVVLVLYCVSPLSSPYSLF